MNAEDEALLDRYLDGLLAGAEKTAFEQRVAREPELQRAVSLQKKLDGALARAVPPAPDARAVLEAARRERAISKPGFGRKALVAVVALAAAVMVALAAFDYVFVEPPEPGKVSTYAPRDKKPKPFEQVYAERVASGFKPDWVCKDDAEFVATFKREVSQGLKLGKLEPNVAGIGLAYVNTLSPWTVAFLAKVDGQPVIVFVDPLSYDSAPTLPPGSKLKLHRRAIEKLVLYELSPFEKPRVLGSFEKP